MSHCIKGRFGWMYVQSGNENPESGRDALL